MVYGPEYLGASFAAKPLTPDDRGWSRLIKRSPVDEGYNTCSVRESACQVHPDELEGVLQQAEPLGVVNGVVGFIGFVVGCVGGRIGGNVSGCRAVDCLGYHQVAAKVQQRWRVPCRLLA
jgi:hypothetical protein